MPRAHFYGKPCFADLFGTFGFSALLVGSQQSPNSNPFMATSTLKSSEEDDDQDDASEFARQQKAKISIDAEFAGVAFDTSKICYHRWYSSGIWVFHGKFSHAAVICDYRACAVRESGTSKNSNVVRFSYIMPSELRRSLSTWVFSE